MKKALPLADWLHPSRDNDVIAWQGQRTWRVNQLRENVSHLCARLIKEPGTRWALCCEDAYLFITAMLATLHAGKTPVILGHSRVELLQKQQHLFDGALTGNELALSCRQLCVTSPAHPTANFQLPEVPVNACLELFTSGSTGAPKRIVKSVAAMDREAALLARHFGERIHGCRFVASVSPLHLYGLTFRIFLPMSQALPWHTDKDIHCEQLAQLDSQQHYVFISSPAFLKRLDIPLTPTTIRLVLSAGGVLPWQAANDSHAWAGIWPDEIYGSTETGVIAWRQHQQENTPWHAFSSVTLTAETDGWRLHSDWLDSADGALLDDTLRCDENGDFYILGRHDRVVKVEDKRVSLDEVETHLLALQGIKEAAVIKLARGSRQRLGALLVLDDAQHSTWHSGSKVSLIQGWRQALRNCLDPLAVPGHWRVTDKIPVNSMNKRALSLLQEFFDETP